MSLQEIRQKLKNANLSPSYGNIIKIMPNVIVANGIRPSVGDIIEFYNPLDSVSERTTRDLGLVSAVVGPPGWAAELWAEAPLPIM